jgi:hypothetical protein
MAKQPHMLDHVLGKKLVSSHTAPERRKSDNELRRMQPEDRLRYELENPLSEEEKYDALRREIRDAHYETSGEVDERDLLDNEPPPDWGR